MQAGSAVYQLHSQLQYPPMSGLHNNWQHTLQDANAWIVLKLLLQASVMSISSRGSDITTCASGSRSYVRRWTDSVTGFCVNDHGRSTGYMRGHAEHVRAMIEKLLLVSHGSMARVSPRRYRKRQNREKCVLLIGLWSSEQKQAS